jgi:hypothetical protein
MPLTDDVSQLGDDCYMYVDASGAEGSSWAACGVVIDDNDTLERRTADSNCREDVEIKQHVGKPKFEESGNLLFKRNHTEYEILRDAARNNTSIGVALMNGIITEIGAEGWWRDMKITRWQESRPDGDTIKVAFTMVTDASSTYVSVYKQITA